MLNVPQFSPKSMWYEKTPSRKGWLVKAIGYPWLPRSFVGDPNHIPTTSTAFISILQYPHEISAQGGAPVRNR